MKSLLIIFGKPGAGKSYVADILHDSFGYTIHNGDEDLPADMKLALQNKLPITDNMRKHFLDNIIASARILSKQHLKLVIDQTFLREFMRKQFLDNFPDAQCILIESGDALREKRYMKRGYFNLGLLYLRHMTKLFEAPRIPHTVIYNNVDGHTTIHKQIIATGIAS
jgi:gluconokinase